MILWAGFMSKNPEALGYMGFFSPPQPSRHKGSFREVGSALGAQPGAALSRRGVTLPLSSILVPREKPPRRKFGSCWSPQVPQRGEATSQNHPASQLLELEMWRRTDRGRQRALCAPARGICSLPR